MTKIAFVLFIGAVVEAKAQLVGIHERVRSDAEGSLSHASSTKTSDSLSTTQGVKRVATATNPNAEDAAELLRYKTFVLIMDPNQES